MYRKLLIIAAIALLPCLTFAQYNWDVGGSLGTTNFLGAVGGGNSPAKPFILDDNFASTRFELGGFARYKLSPLLSFKAELSMNRLYGADKYSTYLPRELRNLSFRNDVYELTLTGEVYFFEINGLIQTFKTNVDMRCYGFTGVSFYHQGPEAEINGHWYYLEPLMLTGSSFSLWGMAIPMGVGTYFSINRKNRFGIEIGWNKTFTKYMDDVGDGKYIAPDKLPSGPTDPANGKSVAVELENRSQELASTAKSPAEVKMLSYNYLTGGLRGDSKGDNSWFTYGVTYSYAIRGKSSFYRSKYPGLFGKSNKKRKIRAKF